MPGCGMHSEPKLAFRVARNPHNPTQKQIETNTNQLRQQLVRSFVQVPKTFTLKGSLTLQAERDKGEKRKTERRNVTRQRKSCDVEKFDVKEFFLICRVF